MVSRCVDIRAFDRKGALLSLESQVDYEKDIECGD